MFYPGRVNGIQGESEAGKSWVALISCLVEMNRGNTVVYMDFEDSEEGVVSRLLLIGATPDQIAACSCTSAPASPPPRSSSGRSSPRIAERSPPSSSSTASPRR
jgi:hypothetical protein